MLVGSLARTGVPSAWNIVYFEPPFAVPPRVAVRSLARTGFLPRLLSLPLLPPRLPLPRLPGLAIAPSSRRLPALTPTLAARRSLERAPVAFEMRDLGERLAPFLAAPH